MLRPIGSRLSWFVRFALALTVVSLASAKHFSAWGPPVSMESIPGTSPEFNTPSNDGCPIQSPDGLSFYMASNRPGGFGEGDIYVTRFTEGAWEDPQNLGCSVNSDRGEASPSIFIGEDREPVLYFSSNRAGGFDPVDLPTPDSDIYFSRAFGPAQLVPGLNTSADDSRPNVRFDGREIVFDSNRPGTLGGPDIFSASRSRVTDSWSAPVHLSALSSPAPDKVRLRTRGHQFQRTGRRLFLVLVGRAWREWPISSLRPAVATETMTMTIVEW